MEEKNSTGLFIGGPTILMVLIVLCFSVFSAITLASARNSKILAERTAQTVTDYYGSSYTALKLISELRLEAENCGYENCHNKFSEILDSRGIENSYEPKSGLFKFAVPVDENKSLEADLKLYKAGNASGFVLSRFQVNIDTIENTEPEYLPVLQ